MSCCSEHNCQRKNPIEVRRAPFSEKWVAITRYKRHDSGRLEAQEKHELTAASQVAIELESKLARGVFEFVKQRYSDAADGSDAESAYRDVLDKFEELANEIETGLVGPREMTA